MRYIPILIAFLFFAKAAQTQPFFYTEAMRIIDPAGLTDTLNWTLSMQAELITALGQETAEAIVRNSVPAAWPVGIATEEARLINHDQFAKYITFYITTIHGHLALLLVPFIENSYLQIDMRPATDIYFVVQLQAVASNKALDQGTAPDFAKEMEVLTLDFKNNFAKLTTTEVQEPMYGLPRITGCNVGLAGAYEVYFYEDVLLGDRFAFRAAFNGGHTELDSVYNTYLQLVDQVAALTLSCCQLSKLEESVTGNTRVQRFEVIDRYGDLNPDYENMIIEVVIEEMEVYNEKEEYVNGWEPRLYIYHYP